MHSRLLTLGAAAAVVLLSLNGCGRRDHADHADHAHTGAGHEHQAPHGGVLIEVGDHQANLEFVHDRAAGTLSVYVLDAHAENFVRIAAPALVASATVGGETRTLNLNAVADPATGEAIGDTSHFQAQAEWLKSGDSIRVSVHTLPLPAGTFTDVQVTLP